jgi:N utilization substance protein B
MAEPASEPFEGIRLKSAKPEAMAARMAAVQALYQMELEPRGARAICREYEAHRLDEAAESVGAESADFELFRAIVMGVANTQAEVDARARESLRADWRFSRLDSTLRAILRAGVFELIKHTQTHHSIIVHEYVELTKAFFDKGEPGFVNAALDACAQRVRIV